MLLHALSFFSPCGGHFALCPNIRAGLNSLQGRLWKCPLLFWQWSISTYTTRTGHLWQLNTAPRANCLLQPSERNQEYFLVQQSFFCGRINQMFLKAVEFTHWELHPPSMLAADKCDFKRALNYNTKMFKGVQYPPKELVYAGKKKRWY